MNQALALGPTVARGATPPEPRIKESRLPTPKAEPAGRNNERESPSGAFDGVLKRARTSRREPATSAPRHKADSAPDARKPRENALDASDASPSQTIIDEAPQAIPPPNDDSTEQHPATADAQPLSPDLPIETSPIGVVESPIQPAIAPQTEEPAPEPVRKNSRIAQRINSPSSTTPAAAAIAPIANPTELKIAVVPPASESDAPSASSTDPTRRPAPPAPIQPAAHAPDPFADPEAAPSPAPAIEANNPLSSQTESSFEHSFGRDTQSGAPPASTPQSTRNDAIFRLEHAEASESRSIATETVAPSTPEPRNHSFHEPPAEPPPSNPATGERSPSPRNPAPAFGAAPAPQHTPALPSAVSAPRDAHLPQAPQIVSRGLAAAVAQRGGTIHVRLQPESLGEVRIQMRLDAGSVSVRIDTANPSAHGLLTEHLAMLRSSLEATGLNVERIVVNPAPLATPHAPASPTSSAANQQPTANHDGGASGESAQHDAAGSHSRGNSEEEPKRERNTAQPHDEPTDPDSNSPRRAFASRLRLRLNAVA